MFRQCVTLLGFLFIGAIAKCQSITPYTFNNGGGFTATTEWSIGESVSIANFSTPSLYLNTGVLQLHNYIITSVNELGITVFGDQISIGPNPATSFFHLRTRFSQTGILKVQLLNPSLGIINTIDAGTISGYYDKDVSVEVYPTGLYYLKVFYKPLNGLQKMGVYKIIKI